MSKRILKCQNRKCGKNFRYKGMGRPPAKCPKCSIKRGKKGAK